MTAKHIVITLLELWGGGLVTNEWTGYWMAPNGEMHLVNDHIGWARRYVLKNSVELPADDAGRENAKAGIYVQMSRLGWLKITVEFGKILVDPTRAMRNQMAALQEFAIENNLPILDAQNGRKLFDPREHVPEEE